MILRFWRHYRGLREECERLRADCVFLILENEMLTEVVNDLAEMFYKQGNHGPH